MKKLIKKVGDGIVIYLLRIVFLFLKKDYNMCIFGDFSGKRFGDNSKYLYLYLNNNRKYFKRIIWITSSKRVFDELKKNKYDVCYKYSLKSIYYHLKAKYHFIDQGEMDIFGFFSRNSIRINLWHGIPLKKIMKFCSGYNKKYVGGWENQYLLTCSDFGDKTLGKAFGVSNDKMIKGLYPRVDSLINENYPIFKIEEPYIEKIKELKDKGKTVLLYLPTFRDEHKLKFLGINNETELKDFFIFLKENDYFLMSKIHLVDLFDVSDSMNDIILKYGKEVFLNLESDIDIYPVLKQIDILITDYSSVYFDFLALNKDIIFYPYDLSIYQNADRGLLFNYDEITPGDKVYSIEELKNNLKVKILKRDMFEAERKKLYEVCFQNHTIEDTIKNIINIKELKNEF